MASLVNNISKDIQYISNKCEDRLESQLLTLSVCLRVAGIAIAVFAAISFLKALPTLTLLKILGTGFAALLSHDAIVTGNNIREAVSREDLAIFNPKRFLNVGCDMQRFTKDTILANKITYPSSWNF